MWRIADSTSASGVGSPYFFCRSFSSEPALTPMRIGMPWSRAASITARTRSSRPMLPGLMRRQSTPSSATRRAMLVVEVDVGDQRHGDLALDPAERFGGVHGRHRDAHDIGAGGWPGA